jgi:hypothetical protein
MHSEKDHIQAKKGRTASLVIAGAKSRKMP